MAKNPTHTTPKMMVAGFTAVQKPTLKYKSKTEKEYQITVAADRNDPKVKEFIEKMEAIRDAKYEEVIKEKPKLKKQIKVKEIGQPEYDDDGEETGRIKIKFRQNFEIKGRDGTIKTKITLRDAKGKVIPTSKKLSIGPGSVVRVAFGENAYFHEGEKEVGVSFARMSAVKLIKYEPFSGSDPFADAEDDEDDDDDEDSFSVDDVEDSDEDDEPRQSPGDDDDGDNEDEDDSEPDDF